MRLRIGLAVWTHGIMGNNFHWEALQISVSWFLWQYLLPAAAKRPQRGSIFLNRYLSLWESGPLKHQIFSSALILTANVRNNENTPKKECVFMAGRKEVISRVDQHFHRQTLILNASILEPRNYNCFSKCQEHAAPFLTRESVIRKELALVLFFFSSPQNWVCFQVCFPF